MFVRTPLCAAAGILAAFALAGISHPAAAVEPGLTAEIGSEKLFVPELRFGIIKWNFTGGGGTVATLKNDDGRFSGTRLDLALGTHPLNVAGTRLVLGVKGFLSRPDADAGSQDCRTPDLPPGGGAIPFCTVMPLFDPQRTGGFPAAMNTPFDTPGETITYRTVRGADHWGVAFEAAALAGQPFSVRAGLGHRHLGTDASVMATSNANTNAATLREHLETQYWGAYVGGTARALLGPFAFSLDGDVGLYRARTEYDGFYTARSAQYPNANLTQTLALDRNDTAAISSLKLSIDTQLGPVRVGGFLRGEAYSFAPRIAYNDVDLTGGPGQNLVGANDGTRIAKDHAFSATTGVRISVPLP